MRLISRAALAFMTLVAAPVGAAQASTQIVNFRGGYSAGTVVISMSQRKLYYVLYDGRAVQYPVARIVRAPGSERDPGDYLEPTMADAAAVACAWSKLPPISSWPSNGVKLDWVGWVIGADTTRSFTTMPTRAWNC